MKKKNSAAVKLGKIKTNKKAAASRKNGRKGGRKESQTLRELRSALNDRGNAAELWAIAQCAAPHDGIEDAITRIMDFIKSLQK